MTQTQRGIPFSITLQRTNLEPNIAQIEHSIIIQLNLIDKIEGRNNTQPKSLPEMTFSKRSLYTFALVVLVFGLLGPAPVLSFSTTPGPTASRNRISEIYSSPKSANVEPDLGRKSPIETNDETDLLESELATRRMFVGLIAAGIGSSLLAAEPEIASAKEQSAIASDGRTDEALIESTQLLSDASAVDWNGIFKKASKRALGGGKAGASAAVIQVLSLMWLRTSMNRQYRYGGNLSSSLKELWKEGGLPRLYQGLPFALVQGPLTRFGDTAANVGILALLESFPETQSLPLPVKTGIGSISAGLWRIFLMPIDSSKTAMQVEGENGLKELVALVQKEGPAPLYNGALAQAAATAAGHFPWFLTYNYVDDLLPTVTASEDLLLSLARSAFLGLCASSVSDVTSNSLRVIKTTKQTARLGKSGEEATADGKKESGEELSYGEVVKSILETDGLVGLFGRGLQTRLLTNAIQGSLFSVLFKYFQQVS